jgi:two-component system, LytTR family, response regulator
MNCIAIDDKPLSLNVLKNFCQKIDSINLVATYKNANDALTEIEKNKIDVIFWDVETSANDLEFIKLLPNPPLIIGTNVIPENFSHESIKPSLKENYSINCFEVNTSEFPPKNISFNKFLNMVNDTSVQLSAENKDSIPVSQSTNNHSSRTGYTGKLKKYFFVKVDYSIVKINFNEIRYVEGLKDYVKIYVSRQNRDGLSNEKPLITKSTIKNMESKLPAGLFTRVHKSYIISIDKIDKIEYNHIFIGQKKIPIGMQFKDSFYKQIDCFRL